MIYKLCLFLSLGLTGVSYAQQYSSSPFSTQGLGEAGGLEDGQFGAIGGCRTALADSATVNLFNPSSYTALSKGQPLFAIGISSRLSQYTAGGQSSYGRVAGMNQITMALPLTKRFGMAIGLQPFTRRGYEIQQDDLITTNGSTDTVRYTYSGSGGTQQVLGGLAWKPLDLKRHELSIGANYGFIFGSATNERQSVLMSNSPSGYIDQLSYRVHGWQYSVGLNYTVHLDTTGKHSLRIGMVLTPEQQLSAHRDYMLTYNPDVDAPNATGTDTLKFTDDDKGHIVYPSTMAFGFNYAIRATGGENYKLKTLYQINIYGDFVSTMWTGYAANFSSGHDVVNYGNTNRYSFGVQYTPNYQSHNRVIGISYLNRVRYRIGGYYGTLPNFDNGTQLTEKAITFGFGLPIASQKTNSSFNFSFQYGTRGSNQPAGLNEKFISLNVGIILAPSSYDKWFKKYKLD